MGEGEEEEKGTCERASARSSACARSASNEMALVCLKTLIQDSSQRALQSDTQKVIPRVLRCHHMKSYSDSR